MKMILKAIVLVVLLLPYHLYAGDKNILDTIQYLVSDDLSKKTGFDVEISNIRVVKGQEILNNNQPKSLKKVQMDKLAGKNRAYYIAILDDRRDGLTHLMLEVIFEHSTEVYVTSRQLPKGTTLTSKDFFPVKQKMSRLLPGTITSREGIEGKILQHALGQGVVIRDF
ncbi:MAG: SAF domain-containing protein, partial [Thermodesulfovibrionales bacterium]